MSEYTPDCHWMTMKMDMSWMGTVQCRLSIGRKFLENDGDDDDAVTRVRVDDCEVRDSAGDGALSLPPALGRGRPPDRRVDEQAASLVQRARRWQTPHPADASSYSCVSIKRLSCPDHPAVLISIHLNAHARELNFAIS